MHRMKQNNPSPRTKVNKQIRQLPHATIKKTLLFHEALVKDIQEKYSNSRGEKERPLISKIVTGRVVKKYRLQRLAQISFGFSKKRWLMNKKYAELNLNYQRKRNNRVADGFIKKVHDFYTRDDVSRITTGKRQTLTQKKIKNQKRFLLDTMKNVHVKFLAEHDGFISYSSSLHGNWQRHLGQTTDCFLLEKASCVH